MLTLNTTNPILKKNLSFEHSYSLTIEYRMSEINLHKDRSKFI